MGEILAGSTESKTGKPPAATCPHCGKSFGPDQGSTPPRQTDLPGVLEMGYLCPYCEAWVHSHYMNAKALALFEDMTLLGVRLQQQPTSRTQRQFNKAMRNYRHEYKRLNG